MENHVTIIIPAYNEERNIMHVLRSVTTMKEVQEIICVDDGSTDRTAELLVGVAGIHVISLEKNHGKAYAIAAGIRQARGDIVVLLDADLHEVTPTTVKLLITPLLSGTHDAVVGYPSKTLDKFFKPISGQRAYFKRDLLPLLDILEKKGYGLELYLNFAFRQRRVKSLILPGVFHIVKHKKQPIKKALRWYISELKEILSEIFLQENPFSYFASTYIFPFYWERQLLRVLFVYDSLSPIGGGSQVVALTWLKDLQAQGVVVKILCNKNAPDFIKEFPVDTMIGLPYLNLHKLFPHYYPTLFLSKRIKEHIRQFVPDIIHVHEPTLFASQVLSFAKKEGIPTIFSFQTDFSKQTTKQVPLSFFIGTGKLGSKLLEKWEYYLCRQADFVTVPTRYYQEQLTKKVKKKIYLLYLPIKNYFYTIANPPKKKLANLLVVSRLIENKHIDVLVKMMQYLDCTFHLTIVGDGPDRQSLHTLVKTLRLEQAVTFINWVQLEDLPKLFVSSDIYLSASDSETFGLTYISSLVTKTPCILYDYPVSREIIPQDSALFLKTLDPKHWAEAVVFLRDHMPTYDRLRQSIEKQSAEFEKYNEFQSTKQLDGIYKHILETRSE